MKVCYNIHTHKLPHQVFRLVTVIKEQSPESLVLISHSISGVPLDVRGLESIPGVHVLPTSGGYGDFSHIDRYLGAVDWLIENDADFDWFVNLTGQDYPARPLEEIEKSLEATDFDGFLLHARILEHGGDGVGICTPRTAHDRYLYRHWRFGLPTERKQRWQRPFMVANFLQPWLRVSTSYSSIGVRRKKKMPFTDDFVLYGGSFFCTLSSDCVHYIREFARENPDLVRFLRAALSPEEAFFHVALVNSGKFRLCNDSKRYFDLTGTRHGHPRILSVDDLDRIVASGAHFARKFDMTHDSQVLDLLDTRVLQRMPR